MTIDFPPFWLVKIRRLWSDNHWLVTNDFAFSFKMAACFALAVNSRLDWNDILAAIFEAK